MKFISFIKVGAKEHMQNLLEKGEVYCNTLEYFRKIELGNGGKL